MLIGADAWPSGLVPDSTLGRERGRLCSSSLNRAEPTSATKRSVMRRSSSETCRGVSARTRAGGGSTDPVFAAACSGCGQRVYRPAGGGDGSEHSHRQRSASVRCRRWRISRRCSTRPAATSMKPRGSRKSSREAGCPLLLDLAQSARERAELRLRPVRVPALASRCRRLDDSSGWRTTIQEPPQKEHRRGGACSTIICTRCLRASTTC